MPWFRRRTRPYAPRRRFGFRGPFPTYRTRTRRGSEVSVSGCCLPIPLLAVVGTGAGLRAVWRWARR
jgi:hypothetical protein